VTIPKYIEVLIAPDGSTRIETKGFSGSQCQEASRYLEQALGLRSTERLTAEFYAASQASIQQEGQA
jgi:hypothetical protein